MLIISLKAQSIRTPVNVISDDEILTLVICKLLNTTLLDYAVLLSPSECGPFIMATPQHLEIYSHLREKSNLFRFVFFLSFVSPILSDSILTKALKKQFR